MSELIYAVADELNDGDLVYIGTYDDCREYCNHRYFDETAPYGTLSIIEHFGCGGVQQSDDSVLIF